MEFHSVESALKELSPESYKEVTRVLYGTSAIPLDVPKSALAYADTNDFELQAYSIGAAPEEVRKPRLVRVGLIQNKIVLPTNAPVLDQIEAIHKRIATMLEAAHECGVNIVCFQEAWSRVLHLFTSLSNPYQPLLTSDAFCFLHKREAPMDPVCGVSRNRSDY
eukprot:Colp12_sorted_trinity150504_noHs@16760